MKKTIRTLALVLALVAVLVSAAACAAPTPTPTPLPTSTPTPSPSPTPSPTPTPAFNRYPTDIVLKVSPTETYAGATMELKTDGTFKVTIPGFPGVDGTDYDLKSDGTVAVTNGLHNYTYTMKDGEIVVELSAGGGAVKIKFYSNYDKYQG